jgi:hypothetical protein
LISHAFDGAVSLGLPDEYVPGKRPQLSVWARLTLANLPVVYQPALVFRFVTRITVSNLHRDNFVSRVRFSLVFAFPTGTS